MLQKLNDTKIQNMIKEIRKQNLNLTNKIRDLKKSEEYKELMGYVSEYKKLSLINTQLLSELSEITQIFQDNAVKIKFEGKPLEASIKKEEI